MGVKTKIWGPHAWIFIHTAAAQLDLRIRDKSISAKFWNCLRNIVPCIHCRNTFGQMPGSVSGNIQSAYDLHERVNMKLFKQDLETYATDEVIQKWAGYQPRIEDVPMPSILKMFDSTIMFLYYCVLDMDDSRCGYLYDMIDIIGRIFDGTRIGPAWKQAVIDVGTPRCRHRLRYIFSIEKEIRSMLELGDLIPFKEREKLCATAVVL